MSQPSESMRPAEPAGGADRQGVVLLVDDEPNILTSLKRALRPENLHIITAGSGREGLDILRGETVDVVISDMRMPEMDGAEFLGEVAHGWPRIVRILLTGYADLGSTVDAINRGGIFQYLSKPWEDHELSIAIRNALEKKFLEDERLRLQALTEAQNAELKSLNEDLERRVEARTRELRAALERLDNAHSTLKRNFVATVKVFSGVLEARDPALAGHSKRVAELARVLGQLLHLGEEDMQHLLFAALLHDIGKVGLPDSLLTRPFNALPGPERARVARHPVIGEALLMGLESLQEAARLIRAQHERYDGRGYPDGLAGEAIPLGARILALANDYDALQVGTLYTQRLMPGEVLDYICDNRGKRYDPAVVDALLRHLRGESPRPAAVVGRIVQPDELRPGMVLARDLVTRDRLLLLSEGFVLDDKLIEKIQKFGQVLGEEFQVCIRDDWQGG